MKLPIPLLLFTLLGLLSASAQKYVVKDIKSFGARGNGKTNDHEAFEKAAAYFNKRGGNGKLTISAGTYLVGKQLFTAGKDNQPAFNGFDVLHFNHVKNFDIAGTSRSILKYTDSLRIGAFVPETGLPYDHGNNEFRTYSYAAFVGKCILFDSCHDVSVTNIIMDGNSKALIPGGVWGDVGRQLTHIGIFIQNSYDVSVDKVNIHHFGLDGIYVSNKVSSRSDSIRISNSSFEYNARQGLSWVGGNNLVVRNCKFNHTGKAGLSSPPSAGIDIEAQAGPARNGSFINCELIDNTGVGLLAGTGDNGDCTFTGCIFWGVTNWSIWVTKPGFTFNKCNIYGSIVHGYNSPDDKNATRYNSCIFEDKLYNGKDVYGNFLVESNNAKRVSFTNCNFIANKKKLFWITNSSDKPEEKYQFDNCRFLVKSAEFPQGDYVGVMRGMRLKNCTFTFQSPTAKIKGHTLLGFTEKSNVDLGGNKIIYSTGK